MQETVQPEYPVAFTAQSVKKLFRLLTIFWWVGVGLTPIAIGLPFVIVAIVFACILLYRHWALLQGHGARTTPGRAVGFSFIPFYCFYWWFVACVGLARDNNNYMDCRGMRGQRMSCGLALTICIINIVICADLFTAMPLIPFVFVLWVCLLAINAVLGFLFFLQQKNCMIEILGQREMASQPSQ